ncbi:cell wall metabolism sensor histidine kinase WalK [Candidatus Bipolaricaulota bacterium]|nr:cell wall metabolism sensor histidine kinase WalK [Candidatus Bipolaricaulota bacterium]
MIYSIRWKLLVGFILIVVVAIGTVAFVANRSATGEFDRYITQDQALKYQRLSLMLSSYYEQTGSWEGAQELIDRISKTYQNRIVLTSDEGSVVADTAGDLMGNSSQAALNLKIATLGEADNPSGFLYLKDRKRSELEKIFLSSVNNSITFAAIISVLAAIFLTLIYSRRTLKPIKDITSAAERIEHGNLDQEVDVRSRDEVGKLASAFNSMAEELKKQERLRKNMVSDVAHELRSPLTKIHGYLKAIKEGTMETNEKAINSLYRNSRLLKRLVDDLHDLTMAEAGRLNLDKQPILLDDIVSRVVESINLRLEEENIELNTESNGEILLNVDPDRIHQVLLNLLENAIVHSPEGGTIQLDTELTDNQVEISISDEGEGIPKEDLPHVFDRFYRVDRSRSRTTGGTGLGLTISKELVEAHEGKVEVRSEKGEGSTFTVTLPYKEKGVADNLPRNRENSS